MASRTQPTVRAHLRQRAAQYEQRSKNASDMATEASYASGMKNTEEHLKTLAKAHKRKEQAAKIMAGDFVHEQKTLPVPSKKRQSRKGNARVQTR